MGYVPSSHQMAILDLRTFKPDMRTSLHHGPLYDAHEPSVDLAHLSKEEEARGHFPAAVPE